jgi:hypothetical protein
LSPATETRFPSLAFFLTLAVLSSRLTKMAARLGLNRLPLRTATTRLLLPRPLLLTPTRIIAPAAALVPFSSPFRFYSSATPPATAPPAPTTHLDSANPIPPSKKSPEEKLGLSQRLKALFRKHGWSALVIYLLLSLLDFGLTFVFIYAVGADKVRAAEDWVLDTLGWRRKDGEPGKIKKAVDEWKEQHPRAAKKAEAVTPHIPAPSDMIKESEQKATPSSTEAGAVVSEPKSSYSAIASTAVLAYAIHKTLLLPVRVGVTVSWLSDPPRRLDASTLGILFERGLVQLQLPSDTHTNPRLSSSPPYRSPSPLVSFGHCNRELKPSRRLALYDCSLRHPPPSDGGATRLSPFAVTPHLQRSLLIYSTLAQMERWTRQVGRGSSNGGRSSRRSGQECTINFGSRRKRELIYPEWN